MAGHVLMLVELEQYELAWQRGQSTDLAVSKEYLPVTHTWQSDAAPLPVAGLYVPAKHMVGLTDWTGQKLPIGHSVQSL